MTATSTKRRTEAICPPWCTGHEGHYQGWESRYGEPIRDHASETVSVDRASVFVNQVETLDHSLEAAYVDVEVDCHFTPTEAREFGLALIAAAGRAEANR